MLLAPVAGGTHPLIDARTVPGEVCPPLPGLRPAAVAGLVMFCFGHSTTSF